MLNNTNVVRLFNKLQMTSNTESALGTLVKEIKTYLELNVQNVKLTAAEKTVALLSALAITGLAAILGMLTLLFLSIAIADFIAPSLGAGWAFLIVTCVYLLLLVIIIVFRRALIINPVSRFITRLFLS